LFSAQPFRFLNQNAQTQLDYSPEYFTILDRRVIGHGQYVRHFGIFNNLLGFGFIIVRFCLVVYHLVWFYFESNVQLKRVMEIFNVQMDYILMIKTIYQKYKVSGTAVLCLISLVCFLTLMIDFEMNINVLQTVFETMYYLVITMTTVGFGDIHADSFAGQNSIILATCAGVVFEGMFLTAWADYIELDTHQSQAFMLLTRLELKKKM